MNGELVKGAQEEDITHLHLGQEWGLGKSTHRLVLDSTPNRSESAAGEGGEAEGSNLWVRVS